MRGEEETEVLVALKNIVLRQKNEINSLKKKVQELSGDLDENTQFKLSVLEKMPFAFWACRRSCEIVVWNKAAEHQYHYPADEAIGRDFVELFVHQYEADQAREDCIDIVDNKRVIRNIAHDVNKLGQQKKLLTHCFPMYHEGWKEYLQVEMSFEISDVEKLEQEICDIRDKAKEKVEVDRRVANELVVTLKSTATQCLSNHYASVQEEANRKISMIKQSGLEFGASEEDKSLVATKILELTERKRKIELWNRRMASRISSASDAEDLQHLMTEINQREIE